MSERKDVITIVGKANSYRMTATMFLEQFEEKLAEGYVLHPKPNLREVANFSARPRATMVTKEYAEKLLNTEKEAAYEAEKSREAELNAETAKVKAEEEAAELKRQALVNKPDEYGLAPDKEAAAAESQVERANTLTLDERLKSTHKKDELLELAKELEIKIPTSVVMPKQVKKIITDHLKEMG